MENAPILGTRCAGGSAMTRTMKTSIKAALLAVAASAALVACGGGGDGGVAPAPASGRLGHAACRADRCAELPRRQRGPRQGVSSRSSACASISRRTPSRPTGGWTDVVRSVRHRKINLLDLTNGRLEELGTTPIPAGNYTQVRLVLSANQGNQTANSLVLAGADGRDPAAHAERRAERPEDHPAVHRPAEHAGRPGHRLRCMPVDRAARSRQRRLPAEADPDRASAHRRRHRRFRRSGDRPT